MSHTARRLGNRRRENRYISPGSIILRLLFAHRPATLPRRSTPASLLISLVPAAVELILRSTKSITSLSRTLALGELLLHISTPTPAPPPLNTHRCTSFLSYVAGFPESSYVPVPMALSPAPTFKHASLFLTACRLAFHSVDG